MLEPSFVRDRFTAQAVADSIRIFRDNSPQLRDLSQVSRVSSR
jgi:hypothetical protein